MIPDWISDRIWQPPPREAVIADLDGTLVDVSSVRHFVVGPNKDFYAFHKHSRHCPPHQQAIDFCQRHYDAGRIVVIVTARMYYWEDLSTEWLKEYMPVPFLGPFMRGDHDNRLDREVKQDIYDILTQDYNLIIVEAVDDNPRIVELWEDLGIPVELVPSWDHEAAEKYAEQAVQHKHIE